MRIHTIDILKPVVLAGAVCLMLAGCGRQEKVSLAAPSKVEKQAVAVKQAKPKEEKPPKLEPVKPEDTGPKFVLKGEKPTLNWVEKGSLRMRATANELNGDEINRVAVLKNFAGEMYENGKISTMLTAPQVVADTPKRIVTASEGVVLKSLDRKTVVTAKWIRWFAKEQKVIGIGNVKISSEMGNMTGAAFEADTSLKTLKVKDSAKGMKIN